MIRLENIVRGAVSRLGRLLLVGAVAATMYACDGKATPTPVPTEPTRPAPTSTYAPPKPTETPYNAAPTPKPSPTAEATKVAQTSTPEATATPRATKTPIATSTPAINNSYDFGKSLGLEADYLKEVKFDDNTKGFISYLSTMPLQMRAIAERSGLVKKLDDKQTASGVLDDRQINSDELGYFKRVMESYRKDIEAVQPWLKQISEQESLEALALNLSNFREADEKGQLLVSLKGENVPGLLSPSIFIVDGKERKYEIELIYPDARTSPPYATAAIKNIKNFWQIHNNAREIANDPNYKSLGRSIEEILHQGYFEAEAVGSTDKGRNAYKDMKLLLESGSDATKAALRLYAVNLTNDPEHRDRGNWSNGGQARVELTGIDSWSIGALTYEVVLRGHDVPAIRVTDGDIKLLKERSPNSLLILDIDDGKYLPIQWTRKSTLRPDVKVITLYNGTNATELNISDLKNY